MITLIDSSVEAVSEVRLGRRCTFSRAVVFARRRVKCARARVNLKRTHGAAVVPEFNHGFTSNGQSNSAAKFDLKTLLTIKNIPLPAMGPDGFLKEEQAHADGIGAGLFCSVGAPHAVVACGGFRKWAFSASIIAVRATNGHSERSGGRFCFCIPFLGMRRHGVEESLRFRRDSSTSTRSTSSPTPRASPTSEPGCHAAEGSPPRPASAAAGCHRGCSRSRAKSDSAPHFREAE